MFREAEYPFSYKKRAVKKRALGLTVTTLAAPIYFAVKKIVERELRSADVDAEPQFYQERVGANEEDLLVSTGQWIRRPVNLFLVY